MAVAVAVAAGSVLVGWEAVDQVCAENARQETLSRLRQISQGIQRQGLDGLATMVRDLADRTPVSAPVGSDTARDFLSRMEGEMRIARADLGFLLDTSGIVRMRRQESGERDLIGQNLAFRRYYTEGRAGREDLYGALGAFTSRRGIYASAPVFRDGRFKGVMVARLRAEEVESLWLSSVSEPLALISPEGVVLASNVPDWRLATLASQDSSLRRIRASRQFGDSVHPLGVDLSRSTTRWNSHPWSVLRTDLHGGWTLVGLLPRAARIPLSPSQAGAAWGLAVAWSLLILLGASVVTGLRRIGKVEKERVHLTRRLDEAERLESLGRLAGGVAHDFNNVLTAIIGYASVLEHRLADRPQDQDLAHRSGQAARRASETVRQLMAFARRSGLQVRPLSLHELVREVAGLLEHTLPRGIRVELDFQASRDVLVGDASHLHQALLNLAVNARDAMPQGGTLRFSTRVADSTPEKSLELRVSDTGDGISGDVLPHVFEPFFTTKSGGRGTGLGLASVWGTVQRHGGSISVHSAPGEGTAFVINFPLAPPGTEGEAATAAPSTRLSGRKLRIAALDDDVHVLDVVATMAHSLGHQVDVYGNYQSLRDRLGTGDLPDLVILDLDMPDVPGLDVLRRVQKEYPRLPVMIASGHSSSGTLEEIRKLGVRVFLRKPFGASDLDRALEEALREPAD
jgi:C4-dicarboxylate-specific signal transduction histidine kinase/CheY-like chemotaxis protein